MGIENEVGVQFLVTGLGAGAVFSNFNNRSMEIELKFEKETKENWPFNGAVIFKLTAQNPTPNFHLAIWIDGNQINNGARFVGKELRLPGDKVTFDFTLIFSFLRMLDNSFYIGPFRNALNLGTQGPYFDIHVGRQFIDIWAGRQTNESIQSSNKVSMIEDGLAKLFDLTSLSIIPNQDHSDFLLKINGRNTLLSTMGSGFTQFLLLLGNVAFQEPSFILIDEPELNLHPALQMEFLTTLGEYAKDNLVFFSTHNVGLARSVAEFIYCLRVNPEGFCEVGNFEGTKNLVEFLGELSYSNCPTLSFKKVLLVEGPSDIKVIRHFVRLHGKDQDVFLMHLQGGSQINGKPHTEAQLSEMKTRVGDVSVIIDSEKNSSASELDLGRKAFVDLCRKTGIECLVLKRRAIENYLPDEAIQKVFGPKYKGLEPYEKLEKVSPGWSKNENWRIACGMSLSDLDGTDLGEFLKNL